MKSTGRAESDTSKGGSTPAHLSASELAEILGMTDRAVRWKSQSESWEYEEVSGRGGMRKQFCVSKLPSDIRRRVRVHFGEIPAELAGCVPAGFDGKRTQRCLKAWDAARDWQQATARARLAVLEAIDTFRAQSKRGRRAAVDRFVELYRKREAPGVDPQIYDQVKKISRSQLYEWERAFESEGIAGLISRNGHARGKTTIDPDQQRFILVTVQKAPHLKASKIARLLAKRFNGETADRRQITKFLRAQREADPTLFQFIESPDEYKSKYQLALGDAGEKAERFLHFIEVDSTPADVLCADGKRYAVIGGIDIFSRKAMFQLSRTSNSWAIAALMRRIILDWGIPENLVRDNGQDYNSNLVNESLGILGVNIIAVPPFSPERKPFIERVFGTMTGDLFEVLPGYIGHNVADRRKIESRQSFADRLSGNKPIIQIGLAPAELQGRIDRWTEQEYHQARHGSLGTSPNAKASSVPHRPRRIEDSHALDILLAPAGERIVRKKGLQYENGLFWDDGLIDWVGRKVIIRQDMYDAGRVFCFDPASKGFICAALDMAISGITVGDKKAAQKRADKRVRERAKALRKLAEEVGDPLAEELSEAKRSGALHNLPVGEPITDNPFVDAAMAAASAAVHGNLSQGDHRQTRKSAEPSQIFPDAVMRHEEPPADPKIVPFVKSQQQQVERLYFKNPREKFEYYRVEQRHRELRDEEVRGLLVLINDWWDYADMFCDQWPECDQRWLGRIAPDHFPQYAREDSG